MRLCVILICRAVSVLLNCRIDLSIVLGTPIEDALAQTKALICALIDEDPDDLYDQFVSHDDLKSLVGSAVNPDELLEVVRSLGEK